MVLRCLAQDSRVVVNDEDLTDETLSRAEKDSMLEAGARLPRGSYTVNVVVDIIAATDTDVATCSCAADSCSNTTRYFSNTASSTNGTSAISHNFTTDSDHCSSTSSNSSNSKRNLSHHYRRRRCCRPILLPRRRHRSGVEHLALAPQPAVTPLRPPTGITY